MRFVPAMAGIDPTKVAVRAAAAGPLWHAASLTRSGGAWACAPAGSAGEDEGATMSAAR